MVHALYVFVLCMVLVICQADNKNSKNHELKLHPNQDLEPQYKRPKQSPSPIPFSPCPQYFNYEYNMTDGLYFGYIKIPYFQPSRTNVLEVEMVVSSYLGPHNGLGIRILGIGKSSVEYGVVFPYAPVLPNLLELRFNDVTICRGRTPILDGPGELTQLLAVSTMHPIPYDPIPYGGIGSSQQTSNVPYVKHKDLHAEANEPKTEDALRPKYITKDKLANESDRPLKKSGADDKSNRLRNVYNTDV